MIIHVTLKCFLSQPKKFHIFRVSSDFKIFVLMITFFNFNPLLNVIPSQLPTPSPDWAAAIVKIWLRYFISNYFLKNISWSIFLWNSSWRWTRQEIAFIAPMSLAPLSAARIRACLMTCDTSLTTALDKILNLKITIIKIIIKTCSDVWNVLRIIFLVHRFWKWSLAWKISNDRFFDLS